MTNQTTNRARHLQTLRQQLAQVDRHIAGYRQMLKIAIEYNMETEIDRINTVSQEWWEEGDTIMSAALDAGFSPEDFES